MGALGKIAMAVLGLLVYKNRGRLGALIRGEDRSGLDRDAPQQAHGGGLLEGILDGYGAGDGLDGLLDRLRAAGAGDKVDSWIGRGPNKPIEPGQIEAAIDPDTLDALSAETGLARDELLERLAVELPETVDEMTPQGRLPGEEHRVGLQ